MYAVLTDAGQAKLRGASTSHVAQIDEHFGEALGTGELEKLAELLARLDDARQTEDCTPPS